MTPIKADHFVFCPDKHKLCTYLVTYVDRNIITGDDSKALRLLKENLN